ncbi:hypothetical protein ACLK1G_10240 [Pseudomonas sp. NR3]|uniref:hypothetical protein n=1 Tax=Pseudomonas sp. NR3 TaxID=3155978 RepID=UPI003B6808F1
MQLPIKLTVPKVGAFPKKSMRLLVGSAVLVSAACSVWHEQGDGITAINASYSTRCAEEDNVYLKLVGQDLHGLRIESTHPVYIDSLVSDSSAPDFSGCSFNGSGNIQDPVFEFSPKRVVLWESDGLLIKGLTFERFWRSEMVEVSVNGTKHNDIHLIQVFFKEGQHPARENDEFLVLYPPDGYWRLKPLPMRHLINGLMELPF